MARTTRETRTGIDQLTAAVGRASQVREASPADTGAMIIGQLSARLNAIERRIQAQEAIR